MLIAAVTVNVWSRHMNGALNRHWNVPRRALIEGSVSLLLTIAATS